MHQDNSCCSFLKWLFNNNLIEVLVSTLSSEKRAKTSANDVDDSGKPNMPSQYTMNPCNNIKALKETYAKK